MADETPDDVMHSVCDPELPDAGEVWGGVLQAECKSAYKFDPFSAPICSVSYCFLALMRVNSRRRFTVGQGADEMVSFPSATVC
jgi:hypothetical protein